MPESLGKTAALENIRWGTHLCHFYETGRELADVLVPYFRAGIERRERCVWVTADPLGVEDARSALRAAVPDLAAREASGQIEIHDYRDWYELVGGNASIEDAVGMWVSRMEEGLRRGYEGLRLTGNTSFLKPCDWSKFTSYEAEIMRAFQGRRMVGLCSYASAQCGADEVLDVVHNHDHALVRRDGAWDLVESAPERAAGMRLGAPLHLEPVDAAAVAREVGMAMADELGRAGCALSVRAAAPAVGLWDRACLELIFVHLLSNAATHAPGTPVEVEVIEAGGRVMLSVRDGGPGIRPADQRRVFERFVQLGPARSRGGCGLGLWVVREHVRALGGTIHVASHLDHGATFLALLPQRGPARG
ncbi:MEDS domain-containing protein [Polyangium aurulentum]|uniref:MEDS domain-containing protein n=1 Tax=Polyangium aurulentum TaxID=2567896 RepID=UPI00146B1F04|nr:MEDS domain-containing protein [Polyangium aurulentum]UQA59771.1 MEDS domain-containing protein [Polyangium aurulentum]